MMAVRKIASSLLKAPEDFAAGFKLVNLEHFSRCKIMLESAALHALSLRHHAPFLLKPMRQVVSTCVVGFLVSVSAANAAPIKLASADKESALIPAITNLDDNSPTFSSHIRTLAASCAACHGTNGNSVGGMPVLAGLDPTRFVVQMQAFRSGERASTVMHHHAKGLTPEEIEQLSSYFGAQKRVQVTVPASQKLDIRHED